MMSMDYNSHHLLPLTLLAGTNGSWIPTTSVQSQIPHSWLRERDMERYGWVPVCSPARRSNSREEEGKGVAHGENARVLQE